MTMLNRHKYDELIRKTSSDKKYFTERALGGQSAAFNGLNKWKRGSLYLSMISRMIRTPFPLMLKPAITADWRPKPRLGKISLVTKRLSHQFIMCSPGRHYLF